MSRRPCGRLVARKPRGASNMVNPKLRHCALGSAVRPGTDSPSQERQLSRARVQTAAFLQQVPTTMELGPYRAGSAEFFWLPNWGLGDSKEPIVGRAESVTGAGMAVRGVALLLAGV